MRVSLGTCDALFLMLRAIMRREQIERRADRTRLSRVERKLKAAFEAAERMFRVRVFLADHIYGQLVIFDELHARSLSRWRIA